MTKPIYRYRFSRAVPASDIEETLILSLIAVESLHGPARLRMDARYHLDKANRLCEIDASTQVGSELARIFTGYATREYEDVSITLRDDPTPADPFAAAPCAAVAMAREVTSCARN